MKITSWNRRTCRKRKKVLQNVQFIDRILMYFEMAVLVKWLTRRIVAPVCKGSIPLFRPIKEITRTLVLVFLCFGKNWQNLVIKEKLEISKDLKRKINNFGKFNGQQLKLIEGSIIAVLKTNIACIEPYKLEIGSDTYLIFGKNEIMYISKNNITNKISLQELEEIIRNAKN